MNKNNVIVGTLGAAVFFVTGLVVSPVIAHYSDNAGELKPIARGEGYGYRHQERLAYDECPMHENFEGRGLQRGSHEPRGYGYHRGMMGRF